MTVIASDSTLRVAFAGTPNFAVPSLQALLNAPDYDVVAVYSQPDRPAGRGQALRASPVKQCASAAGVTVEQPKSLRDTAAQQSLQNYQPDVFVVAAYGLLLPQAVLDMPRLGCVNVHASLLPRWRGAAPVQRAILAGDRETGVSIMQMEAGLDTGPVYGQLRCAIESGLTGGELHDRLAQLGAQALLEQLPCIASGQHPPQAQDDQLATYADKLDKSEAQIDWSQSAAALERQVLAFNPWPAAYTTTQGQRLRLLRATAHGENAHNQPGLVLAEHTSGIAVATGCGELIVTELQLAGKKSLSAKDFLNARRLAGQRLGSTA